MITKQFPVPFDDLIKNDLTQARWWLPFNFIDTQKDKEEDDFMVFNFLSFSTVYYVKLPHLRK